MMESKDYILNLNLYPWEYLRNNKYMVSIRMYIEWKDSTRLYRI